MDNALDAQAAKLLARAEQILAKLPDGPWLWAADLARGMGRIDKAEKIESRLLKEKRLPRIRQL